MAYLQFLGQKFPPRSTTEDIPNSATPEPLTNVSSSTGSSAFTDQAVKTYQQQNGTPTTATSVVNPQITDAAAVNPRFISTVSTIPLKSAHQQDPATVDPGFISTVADTKTEHTLQTNNTLTETSWLDKPFSVHLIQCSNKEAIKGLFWTLLTTYVIFLALCALHHGKNFSQTSQLFIKWGYPLSLTAGGLVGGGVCGYQMITHFEALWHANHPMAAQGGSSSVASDSNDHTSTGNNGAQLHRIDQTISSAAQHLGNLSEQIALQHGANSPQETANKQ